MEVRRLQILIPVEVSNILDKVKSSGTPKAEYLTQLILKDNGKEIPHKHEVNEKIITAALVYLKSKKPNGMLKPAVLQASEKSLLCAVAKLHFYVNNSFGIIGAPEIPDATGLAFDLVTNEKEGALRYLNYFKTKVLPEKEVASRTEMFDLAKKLRKKINQME